MDQEATNPLDQLHPLVDDGESPTQLLRRWMKINFPSKKKAKQDSKWRENKIKKNQKIKQSYFDF